MPIDPYGQKAPSMTSSLVDIKGSVEVLFLAVLGYNTNEVADIISVNVFNENPTTLIYLDYSIKIVVLGAAIFKFLIERRKWIKDKKK